MICLPAGAGLVRPAGGGGTAHRYWRVLITAPDGSTLYCGMTELQLRGTAGGADMTVSGNASAVGASSTIGFGNDAFNAFDNNLSTGWLSATAGTAWIQWDFVNQGLGAQYVAQIAITGSYNAPNASPKDFQLQWSDDNVSFTTVLTVTGETGWTGSSDTRVFTVP